MLSNSVAHKRLTLNTVCHVMSCHVMSMYLTVGSSFRLFALRHFLFNPHKAGEELVRNILEWRQQVMAGEDDISLTLDDTKLELSDKQLRSITTKHRNPSDGLYERIPTLHSASCKVSHNGMTLLPPVDPPSVSDSISFDTNATSERVGRPQIRIDTVDVDEVDNTKQDPHFRQPSPLPDGRHHVVLSDFSAGGCYRGPRAGVDRYDGERRGKRMSEYDG